MFWELCEVLINHIQCRLKDGFEDCGHLRREERLHRSLLIYVSHWMPGSTYSQTTDDRSHNVEYFGVSCSGYVAVVIAEDGVEQRRHEATVHRLKIFRLLDECLHQLEDLFLNGAKLPDFGRLCGNET